MSKAIPVVAIVASTIDYPIEVSRTVNNAFFANYCDIKGHRPPYAACLKHIEMVERGGKLASWNECCAVAIDRGTCQALEMRADEVGAGKAIYYIDRKANQLALGITPLQPTEYRRQPKVAYSAKTVESDVAPIIVEPTAVGLAADQGDYAQAINKMMAKSADDSKPFVAPVESVFSTKGMSLAEIAQRRKQSQTNTQQEQL